MFQLQSKDAQAFISDFEQLMVTMTWTCSADFDLFAVYETKDQRTGIVYYKKFGDLNAFPFIKLTGDAGRDDSGGDNEESLVIVKLTDMKYVWLCGWDYPKVKSGQPGRFRDSDVKVTIMDDKGNSFEVPLVSENQGNVARIATIDNSSPISIKLLNSSSAIVLQGLDTDALMSFLQS